MRRGLEHEESEAWRKSLSRHEEDSGYVERYGKNEHAKTFWSQRMFGSFTGIVLIFYVISILHLGWLTEGLIAALLAGFAGLIFWGWRKIAGIRRQDRLYNQVVQRQNGIDERFGRTGADRKKK